jgi:hypothetical protein
MQTADIEQKLLDLINDLDRFRQDRWFSQELNIFKAVGLYRQEIRHSNFLAFLLSPQQNHGLKDGFLKRLIQKASDKFAGDPPIRPLKIALADFSDAAIAKATARQSFVVTTGTGVHPGVAAGCCEHVQRPCQELPVRSFSRRGPLSWCATKMFFVPCVIRCAHGWRIIPAACSLPCIPEQDCRRRYTAELTRAI